MQGTCESSTNFTIEITGVGDIFLFHFTSFSLSLFLFYLVSRFCFSSLLPFLTFPHVPTFVTQHLHLYLPGYELVKVTWAILASQLFQACN